MKSRFLRCMLFGGFSFLLFLVIAFWLRPARYETTAWLQVLSHKPYFVYPEAKFDETEYERYLSTQIALLRSPPVLQKALEDPALDSCPVLARQANKIDWLARQLKIERVDRSKILKVSIRTADLRISETIVNTVIDAYLQFSADEQRQWNTMQINQLVLEMNHRRTEAQYLQNDIRVRMKNSLKKGDDTPGDQAEALADVSFQQTQLERVHTAIDRLSTRIVSLQAERNVPSRIQLRHRATMPVAPVSLCRLD